MPFIWCTTLVYYRYFEIKKCRKFRLINYLTLTLKHSILLIAALEKGGRNFSANVKNCLKCDGCPSIEFLVIDFKKKIPD